MAKGVQTNLTRHRPLIAVAVAVVVAVAGGLTVAWWPHHAPSSSTPAPVPDGPTFGGAYGPVNRSAQNVSGGPWYLFWGVGVASQARLSPNVIGYFTSERLAVNNCGRLLDGLTLWNGSIPLFNGTFDSGTAPFWQFAFYSNATDQILFANNILGKVVIFPALPNEYTAGNCMPWDDLGNPPDPGPWARMISPMSIDTAAIARAAVGALDASWFESEGAWAQIYQVGPGMFNSFVNVPGGLATFFDRCGLAGVTGIQPLVSVATTPTGQHPSLMNGTHNCAVLNYPNPIAAEGLYDLLFSSSMQNSTPAGNQTAVPFQATIRPLNGSGPIDYDAWGLANWMTGFNLTSASGQALPMASTGCPNWVPSMANCVANQSGWYAVLLSEGGEWLASYGATPNGTGWSVPVTSIVSHQWLVIVVPSSWNVTGDRLSVSSTVPTSSVEGSVTL